MIKSHQKGIKSMNDADTKYKVNNFKPEFLFQIIELGKDKRR